MLAGAMFLNPTHGPNWGLILAVVAIIGLAIGFVWIRRITSLDEDPDRSFFRLSGQRGGGSRIPAPPDLADRTDDWLLTRGAIAFGLCSVLFAVGAPLVLRRWHVAFELGPMATLVWLVAIAAAAIGTAWMVRIARRTPEDGGPPWRYRG